jgi:hypothetical protein
MTTFRGLKGLTIVAALLAGGTSLAMAQNGQPTGAYPPVAGGAAGNPITNPGFYGGYYATGGYIAAPGYAVPVAPHRRSLYMYAPPRHSSHHTQRITPAPNQQ